MNFGLWHFTGSGQYLKHKHIAGDNYFMTSAERGDIENLVTATLIIQPRNYVDVGTQVSGQLKKLNMEISNDVKVGDLLAEIDATAYKAKVDAS